MYLHVPMLSLRWVHQAYTGHIFHFSEELFVKRLTVRAKQWVKSDQQIFLTYSISSATTLQHVHVVMLPSVNYKTGVLPVTGRSKVGVRGEGCCHHHFWVQTINRLARVLFTLTTSTASHPHVRLGACHWSLVTCLESGFNMAAMSLFD